MTKIGPRLTVPDDFVTNMQSAYDTDGEFGSHEMNNRKADELARDWPTAIEMARLIEKERDELRELLFRLTL